MFGKAGLGGLMKQAQQMQENMKKAQAKLADTEVGSVIGRFGQRFFVRLRQYVFRRPYSFRLNGLRLFRLRHGFCFGNHRFRYGFRRPAVRLTCIKGIRYDGRVR